VHFLPERVKDVTFDAMTVCRVASAFGNPKSGLELVELAPGVTLENVSNESEASFVEVIQT
jgi:hypothetical protein